MNSHENIIEESTTEETTESENYFSQEIDDLNDEFVTFIRSRLCPSYALLLTAVLEVQPGLASDDVITTYLLEDIPLQIREMGYIGGKDRFYLGLVNLMKDIYLTKCFYSQLADIKATKLGEKMIELITVIINCWLNNKDGSAIDIAPSQDIILILLSIMKTISDYRKFYIYCISLCKRYSEYCPSNKKFSQKIRRLLSA